MALLLASAAAPASAGLADCQGVYVIRVYMNMTTGIPQAVFADSPIAVQGSYWTYPPGGLPDRIYEQVHSMLLTAKSMRLPVGLTTNAPGGCSISAGTHYLTGLELMATP